MFKLFTRFAVAYSLLSVVVLLDHLCAQTSHEQFVKSFIKHYECTPEGRYTHEYHPFLLKKTAQSFHDLEEALRDQNFNLAGRMVIFGYEEQAVPSYYTHVRKPKINDEAIAKSAAGWSLRLHNRFGIMTGFLFKDFNRIIAPEGTCVIEHLNPDNILVFDDDATVFQEDAFGDFIHIMQQARASVTHHYQHGNTHLLYEDILQYWRMLYEDEFKIGNRQVAGTQDILFSIEYLYYLLQSPLSCKRFFTGPDITYPIEISCKQKKEATKNAQDFVQHFIPHLQPVHDEKTVYIFCSFVDGVGKSTMLGNIKNSMKYGFDYHRFEHVNNSSSQLCELFPYNENVFIADMPAQISHFTYKPDGIVFVDASTECDAQQLATLQAYVREHMQTLVNHYNYTCAMVKQLRDENGCFNTQDEENRDSIMWFYKNLILLGKDIINTWIPFMFQGVWYLFHKDQPWLFRVMQDLSSVRSEGLKNIDAEQMFFCHGIRFPLAYQTFVQDVIQQCKAHDIKHVIFVDFLSMYPRSSRENIRINYLQQQMALLDASMTSESTLYRHFTHGGELLHAILHQPTRDAFARALNLETRLRSALCDIIDQGIFDRNLNGVSMETITNTLRDYVHHEDSSFTHVVDAIVEEKLEDQKILLEDTFGLSRSFVALQQTDLHAVYDFAHQLEVFIREHVRCQSLQYLWEDIGELSCDGIHIQHGALSDVVVKTTLDKTVRIVYSIDPECKDPIVLTPIIRLMRARWFMVLCNLLFATKLGYGDYRLDQEYFWIMPLMMRKDADGLLYIVEPIGKFSPWDNNKKISSVVTDIYARFNVSIMQQGFVMFDDRPYAVHWNIRDTRSGIYGYSSDVESIKKNGGIGSSIVSLWTAKYQVEQADKVYPTSLLHEHITKGSLGQLFFEQLESYAVKSGPLPPSGVTMGLLGHNTVFLADMRYKSAIKLFIRMILTMDMLLKDPETDIAIRIGNRKDFSAALQLFEKMVIPLYFGQWFQGNLFKHPEYVEPFPSWRYWEF